MSKIDDDLLNEVMRHLDNEVMSGSMRMSVEYDPTQSKRSNVSHKCCKVYGVEASTMVGELDMYSDSTNGDYLNT